MTDYSTYSTAISSRALLQFRVFGGAIGLDIASSVMNSCLRSYLGSLISAERLSAAHSAAIKSFLPVIRRQVPAIFMDGYNLQKKIITGSPDGRP